MNNIERAATFAYVMVSTVIRRIKGQAGILTHDQIQARLDVCKTCENLGDDGKCSICGCECNDRQEWFSKLAHPGSNCPDNPPRWRSLP